MFSLFSNKNIKVTFINNSTGEIIQTVEIPKENLPESFDQPTTLQVENEEYQVVKAEPSYKRDFSSTKKLTLYLQRVEKIDPANILFTIPTISNEIAPTGNTAIFNDFTLELHEDHWRQIEYLPISLSPTIQEEMADVEKILFPENEEESTPGYKEIHVRSRIGANHLSIPFEEFCELVGITEKGNIKFYGYAGYVENGFALRSSNYTYYGTMQGNTIKELCLENYESAETEFYQLAAQYNLVLVAWCRGEIRTV